MGNKTPAHTAPSLQGAAPSLPHLQPGVEPADVKTSESFPRQGNRVTCSKRSNFSPSTSVSLSSVLALDWGAAGEGGKSRSRLLPRSTWLHNANSWGSHSKTFKRYHIIEVSLIVYLFRSHIIKQWTLKTISFWLPCHLLMCHTAINYEHLGLTF